MNKTEFVKLLAKNMDTSATAADKALKTVFTTIGEVIAKEDMLTFIGFGTFKTTLTEAKKAKIPNGSIVDVAAKRVVKFSVGSELKEKANSKR